MCYAIKLITYVTQLDQIMLCDYIVSRFVRLFYGGLCVFYCVLYSLFNYLLFVRMKFLSVENVSCTCSIVGLILPIYVFRFTNVEENLLW